jgi:hypothetical protein
MNLKSLIRFTLVALLGVAAALLVSCGSSGRGLIPAAKASPLQEDFEKVAQAAAAGNGNCTATESDLGKTEQDFLALPATVDPGLRKRLEEGIENLRKRALSMCVEPTGGATGTTSTTTGTTTTPAKTTTTESTTTPATTTTPPTTTPTTTQTTSTTTSPNTSGGTEAGGEHGDEAGGEHGGGAGAVQENGGGGSNVGGASPGAGQ